MGFAVAKIAKTVPFYSLGFPSNNIERQKQDWGVGGAWPNGVIKVCLPSALDAEYKTDVRKTMKRWEQCVKERCGSQVITFVEQSEMADGVVEIVSNSSNADIGYLPGRRQRAGVDMGRKRLFSLPHELGHCIGLAHEHERSDAPKSVRDYLLAKPNGTLLAKNSEARYLDHGTAFDAMSIMLYADEAAKIGAKEAFANTKRGGFDITGESVKAQSWHPSPGDIEMVRILYS
jgi:hypothetical protein